MTVLPARVGPAPRRLPRPAVAVLAASAVLVLAMVALAVAGPLVFGADDTVSPVELERFEAAVHPAVVDGGEVVELGLKVGLRDLGSEHETAPEVLARQAAGWQRQLAEVQGRVRAVPAHGPLRTVRADVLAAVEDYTHVAEALRDAALMSDATQRDHRLDDAAAFGRSADRLFDRAAVRLQQLRRAAGLSPSPDFPDPQRP